MTTVHKHAKNVTVQQKTPALRVASAPRQATPAQLAAAHHAEALTDALRDVVVDNSTAKVLASSLSASEKDALALEKDEEKAEHQKAAAVKAAVVKAPSNHVAKEDPMVEMHHAAERGREVAEKEKA